MVGQVIATDADEGTNALINYSIRDGDPEDNFNISLSTGEIVTNDNIIDREMVSNFSLTICVSSHIVWQANCISEILLQAMDSGPPIYCPNACIDVTILVQDACDHNPVFEDLPREISIGETTVVGAPVSSPLKNQMAHSTITTGDNCNSF